MKSRRYALAGLSIFLILLVFVSSASAADANGTDILSIDESTSTVNEKLALDYSSDASDVSNDTNVIENEKEILQVANSDDDVLGLTIVSLDCNPKEISVGETIYIEYEVDTTEQGTVFIDLGYCTAWYYYCNPKDTIAFTYSGTETGILAGVFNYDTGYDQNHGLIEVTVTGSDKPDSKINLTISASAEAITAGENATVVVTGFENATGNVTAKTGKGVYTAPIADGIATVIIPGLIENTTAVVTYDGDDNYNNASTAVDIVVNPKSKKDLTLNATAFEIMGNVTLMVSGFENATGNVTVTVGEDNYTTPIMMGMAFMFIPKFNETVTAYIYYPGDDNYNNASTTVDIVAKKNLNLTASADPVYVGENATVIVTGFENATGNVMVIAGRGFYNATIADGVASVSISGLNNTTSAYVIYLGDENYNMAFTSVNITVIEPCIISAPDVTKYYMGPESFVVNVTDYKGTPLANKSVNITINGVTYTRTTNDNGTASLALRLSPGTYYVTTQVDDVTVNSTVTILSTIKSADLTKYYKNATQFTVQVFSADGKAVGAGEKVTFNVHGVLYTRTTNESGIAKLNINLEPGQYIITTSYNGCNVSNNITVLPVLNASDLSMKYLDGSQFKATLLDGQGKPYAGQTIQFNVHGVLYDRLTDSNGVAKLNIRLMVGEYIITSSYNGCNVANTITITS